MATSNLNPLATPFSAVPDGAGEQTFSPDSIREAFETGLQNLSKGDASAIPNLVDMYFYFYMSIKSLEQRPEVVDPGSVDLKLRYLEREVEFLNYENSQLKLQIAANEDATRYMNLRIEGLPEKNNSNLLTQAAKAMAKTGVQCHASDLDLARRIGKFRTGHNRPVLVRFLKESKRNAVLYGRNNLNKKRSPNSKAPLIWINDDVSDITRRNRKNVRDIATVAKQQGITSIRTHGDGIVVDDGNFRHKDLDLLPPNLTLGKAKTREESDDIFFKGEYSPLSNFFPSPILTDDAMNFCSAEQAFQFRKAVFMGYDQTADKILKTRDPYEIKGLANLVPSNEEWKENEHEIMVKILQLKFTQNYELGQFLIGTGEKSLHEATNNSYWAIGVELSSKALEQRNWDGLDTLGGLLMELRSNLITDFSPITNNENVDNDHGSELDMHQISESGSTHGDDQVECHDLDDHSSDHQEDSTHPVLPPTTPKPDPTVPSTASPSPPPPTTITASGPTPPPPSTPTSAQSSKPGGYQQQLHQQTPRTTADYFSPKTTSSASSQTSKTSIGVGPSEPMRGTRSSQRTTKKPS